MLRAAAVKCTTAPSYEVLMEVVMNKQTYHCNKCGVECPTIFETFLHLYTCHNGRDTSVHKLIAEQIIDDAVDWMEWHFIPGRN